MGDLSALTAARQALRDGLAKAEAALEAAAAATSPPRPACSDAAPIDPPGPATVVEVEQAVFTSIRSPMGSGYRIVAASGGLPSEARRQITLRCPSHGNLCSSAAEAAGFMSFAAETGVRCVALSCFAGREHTARGGERVHTHVAILTEEAFALFGCHAAAVAEAIRRSGAERPAATTPERLPRLKLIATEGRGGHESCGAATEREAIRAAAGLLLAGQATALCGIENAANAAARVLDLLPAAARLRVELSCGVKFAPQRRLNFVCVEQPREEAARTLGGPAMTLLDGSRPQSSAEPASHDEWLRFAERSKREGRQSALETLCRRITEHDAAEVLSQIAAVSEAIHRAPTADRAALEELAAATRTAARGALARELQESLRRALARRDGELTRAEQAALAAAAADKAANDSQSRASA